MQVRLTGPIIAALSLSIATLSHAGALNKNNVAADARWVAHFDVEAFLKSHLGEYVTNHPEQMKKPTLGVHFASICPMLVTKMLSSQEFLSPPTNSF